MGLLNWLRSIRYSPYDSAGNFKYLSGRPSDPSVWTDFEQRGEPDAIDEALTAVCDSFDIPTQQKDCLRPDDKLMTIYRHMVGPRTWDDMEFERLWLTLCDTPGPQPSNEELRGLATVGDVVRWTMSRRGPRPTPLMSERPSPRYAMGQRVRVLLNERNKTPHTGTVRHIVWHYKDQRYEYFIEENGKKVSKRYFDDDLEAAAADPN